MKTLLTSPLMRYEDRWGQYHKGAGDTFPIGLGSIAGYLESHGHPVDVIEPDILGMSRDDFGSYLRQASYDLVGISAFTPNVEFALETATLVKSVRPEATVVLGGAHPTIFPEQTLQACGAVDCVITHEGEIPMLQLVEALTSGGALEGVPNLWFRDQGRIVSTGHRSPWLDLDSLPMFPYHKFDPDRYVPAPSLRRVTPTFNYMAQRGCPYECTFCDTRTHGRKVRYRSVEKVIEDLRILKSAFGVRGLVFEGSNFTVNAEYVRDLCEGMISGGLAMPFYSMGRVDLDLDLLPLMKRAGLWCMSFGIESANERTLERMKKRIKLVEVRQTLKAARRLGIRTIGSLILGYPGETEEETLNTIRFACEVDLDIAVFFIPVPFPGTELYEHATQWGGMRAGISWADYSAWLDHTNPIYVNPLIGPRHVDLYTRAFRQFYIRPRQLLRQVLGMRSLEDFGRLVRGFRSVAGLICRRPGNASNPRIGTPPDAPRAE